MNLLMQFHEARPRSYFDSFRAKQKKPQNIHVFSPVSYSQLSVLDSLSLVSHQA